MKNSINKKAVNNFSIKDIFLDKKEHSIRRLIQDSAESAKEIKKNELAKQTKTFEEILLTRQ